MTKTESEDRSKKMFKTKKFKNFVNKWINHPIFMETSIGLIIEAIYCHHGNQTMMDVILFNLINILDLEEIQDLVVLLQQFMDHEIITDQDDPNVQEMLLSNFIRAVVASRNDTGVYNLVDAIMDLEPIQYQQIHSLLSETILGRHESEEI